MNVSRVVLGTLLALSVVTVAGCKAELTVKTKTRYTTPPQTPVVREDSVDWAGEKISIRIEGVGVSVNGGVNVTADPNATKVRAQARMLATAFSDEKANADESLNEATATFVLNHATDGITISCGHGGTHGSSNAGESGCELVEITVPTGAADRPLSVDVRAGNGTLNVQLRSATIGNVVADNNGGDISAEIPSTLGATAEFVSEKADDVVVGLPASWAADTVTLNADADQITNPFPLTGTAYGAAGTGLKSLVLTSKEFAGSSGAVTLRSF